MTLARLKVFDSPRSTSSARRRVLQYVYGVLSIGMGLHLSFGGMAVAASEVGGESNRSDNRPQSSWVLAQAGAKPSTRDALFDDAPATPAAKPAQKVRSRDALFDDAPSAPAAKPATAAGGWAGYLQADVARAYRDPDHWSKARLRADITHQGRFSESVKWKIGGRLDYDAAYDQSRFYSPEVRRDQRDAFSLRENYLDISTGTNWEFRLGRQHVVWGELVGAFVADVVSARDMREFILPEPELQSMRIPQWAIRAEYFGNDMKAELLWIPVPSFDDIGKPGVPGVRGLAGADFYPYSIPGPGGMIVQGVDRPERKLSNTNYGARVSTLTSGWDISGFFYHSLDVNPTFYRQVVPGPTPLTLMYLYQPRHDKIDQIGGTVSKDLDASVFKAEAVYTKGRQFNVTRIAQPNGLVEQDTLDYAVGLDFTLPADARLNLQLFQRVFLQHDPDTLLKKHETVFSVLIDAVKLGPGLEGRLLLAHSLNRSDWLLRPKVTWSIEKNWRLAFGIDIFSGPSSGAFGRFDANDRMYTELRYSF